MNPWKRWQRFRIVISSMERKASEKKLYCTLRHTRLAFHLDHLPLISGTIIGDLKRREAERAWERQENGGREIGENAARGVCVGRSDGLGAGGCGDGGAACV